MNFLSDRCGPLYDVSVSYLYIAIKLNENDDDDDTNNDLMRFFSFLFFCRILDSMKVPGQRSSFHICDILDLNSTDSKNTNNNNNNNTTNNNSNENATDTSYGSHATHSASGRNGGDDGISALTVHPPPSIPPPPYQLPASFNSALYSELGYHSMFPAATKAWLKDPHEHYGKSN